MFSICKKKWGIIMCIAFWICLNSYNIVAANKVELNTYYNLNNFEYNDNFEIYVPKAGRVRLWFEDCTKDVFGVAHGYAFARKNSNAFTYFRQWNRTLETLNSGWISVSQGTYKYIMHTTSVIPIRPNNEAKMRIEYQEIGQYLGEIEPNNTYNQASVVQEGAIYHGDESIVNDEDYYKFSMDHPGKVEIKFKSLVEDKFLLYTLISEDENGNTATVASTASTERLYHYRLPAGNYFIHVFPSEEYSLQVDIIYESEDAYEQENNNVKNSANIKKYNQWYTGNLNTVNDIDVYSFYVPTASKLAVELKVPRQIRSDLYKVTLFDSDYKKLIVASNTSNPYLKTDKQIVKPGRYYIRVEYGNDYSVHYLNDDYSFSLCQEPYTYISKIIISGTSKMYIGKTQILSSTISPIDASNPEIQWSSEDPDIASVSLTGKVSAKKIGTVTITAKAKDGSGIIASKKIQVVKKPSNIKLNKTSLTITVGDSETLKLNGSSGTVKWKTSNKSVIIVNSNGKITGKKQGSAVITVTYKGKKYTCKVTVKNPPQKTMAKNAYQAYAKKYLKKSKYPYRHIKYYDINKDEIPEMIVSYESGVRRAYKFYTYYKGKVVQMHKQDYYGCNGLFYISTNKKYIGIEQSNGASDSTRTLYKISKQKMKKVVTYRYKDGKYYKNGKRISKSTIQAFEKKIYY